MGISRELIRCFGLGQIQKVVDGQPVQRKQSAAELAGNSPIEGASITQMS
jgi:hypothetical protein